MSEFDEAGNHATARPSISHPYIRKRIISHAVRNIPNSAALVQKMFNEHKAQPVSNKLDGHELQIKAHPNYDGPRFNNNY